MNTFWTVYFAVIGLVFGSFFNVVGLRVPNHESIVFPSSHCPHCHHKLRWFENIPLFSFFFLKGKCRSCKRKISWIYPIFEAVTGVLFAFSFYQFGWSMNLVMACLFTSLLVIITVSDLAYMVIPDKILLPFMILFIVIRILSPTIPWWSSWAGAVIGFGLLFLIAVVTNGAMGGGDIKLYFVIGLILGLEKTLLSFFLACLFGSLFGLILLFKGKFKKGKPVPFGPFIAAGAILAFFYGQDMIDFYIRTMWS
ncbi:prepilin peptidase [Bacillus smithii]|uniref:prepilin peptidase n=1 Tax=Bacillus smithii TaxID=1479 RepID=UPI003D1DF92A